MCFLVSCIVFVVLVFVFVDVCRFVKKGPYN